MMNENIRGPRVTSELLPRCNECGRIMSPARDDYDGGERLREGVYDMRNFMKKYLMDSEQIRML